MPFNKKIFLCLSILVAISVIFTIYPINDAYAIKKTTTSTGAFSSAITTWCANGDTTCNFKIWGAKFTGLTAGKGVTDIGINVTSLGTGTSTITNALNASSHVDAYCFFGASCHSSIIVEPFSVSPNAHISSLTLQVSSAAGNVRIKVFSDNAGVPHNLLGESGSLVVSGTGFQTFPVNAQNYGNSTQVWVGFQSDSASLGLFDGTGSTRLETIAYGAGPSTWTNSGGGVGRTPWMSIISSVSESDVRAKIYSGSNNFVATLLGESNSVALTTGINTIPITATVPANGTIWATFETNQTNLGLWNSGVSNSLASASHTYGSGPSTVSGAVAGGTRSPYIFFHYASPTLTLVPTSGPVGTSVTASGTGYEPSTTTKQVYDNGHSNTINTWQGHVSARPFTGILGNGFAAGTKIETMGLNVINIGTSTTQQQSLHGQPNSNIKNWVGDVWATNCFCTSVGTNFPAGTTITTVGLNVTTAAGNIRIKIYNESGTNQPNALLGEGGPFAITTTGMQNFTVSATVPLGNPDIYVAFETDSNALGITGSTADNALAVAHAFGAGPDPFGTVSFPTHNPFFKIYGFTNHANVRVKLYKDDGAATCGINCPSTLLGESGSIPITTTGLQNFTVSATVPASGNIWAAFETDNSVFAIKGTTSASSTSVSHVYGAGPSPFGTTSTATNQPYIELYGNNQGALTFTWDGSALTTNPAVVNTDSIGSFSGVIFSVPSSVLGGHTVNASDTTGNYTTATFTVTSPIANVSFRPMLHDLSVQLTSAKLYAIQNGVIIASATTNSTGWATLSSLTQGIYNFTIFDDKNFAVYKTYNYNLASNTALTVATNDYPFNCISSTSGYQSDFIIRINDTDGTHITNITTPTCPNQSQLLFNMTFTGNGQSSAIYSSSMITTAATQVYEANPSSFTVSGTAVPTTFTGGNNIISNSFTIGPGTSTETIPFVITLTKTQSTAAGGGSTPSPNLNPSPLPNQCPANYVFDSISQQCVSITSQTNLPPSSAVCDPNRVAQGFKNIRGICTAPQNIVNIPIDCGGGSTVTIVSVILPPEAYYQQILSSPFQYACPPGATTVNVPIATIPNTCSLGQTLQNDGTCAYTFPPPIPSTCPADPVSCLIVTPPPDKLQVTVQNPDGSTSVLTETLPSLQSPQLTSLAWLIIFVIIFMTVGGYIYRHFFKTRRKGRKQFTGASDTISKFNKNMHKEFK